MTKVLKNFRLKLFTLAEVIFAFAVITIALSMNIGYAAQIKAGIDNESSAVTLYYLNSFTVLAVFVTMLGIMGIQLIHVYRKTVEIGLRKAVGAKDLDIFFLVLKDTLLLILIPAVIGIGIGVVLTSTLPFERIDLYANISALLIVGCIAALFAFTFFSGLIPAMKAVQMNPADVLRKKDIAKKRSTGKFYNKAYFIIIGLTIMGGIFINYSLEAEYKKDIINSTGTPPATTQAAPSFTFKNADGKIITSETLKGKKYFLLIWDIDCLPSNGILKELNQLVSNGQLKSSDIYAISTGKSFSEVKAYFTENKLSIQPYMDHKKSTKWAFKARSLPVLYIVDEDGIISARVMGWSNAMKEYLLNKAGLQE